MVVIWSVQLYTPTKLIEFWLKNKGKMQGENYQIDKKPLLQIPLPSNCAQAQIQDQVIALVEQILSAKASDANADTSPIERQIDKLVYDLYGLTEEERLIIEREYEE